MHSGFEAFPLALFTTLSPAAIVAFIAFALARLTAKDPAVQMRIDRFIALPFALALIGFIASATHLGTPANALHVFSGVGRSALSNEVLAAVIFLLLAGSYWMTAFRRNFPPQLAHPWLVIACLAGGVAAFETSVAYHVSTVPTWNTWHVPLNSSLSGIALGALLSIMLLEIAHVRPRKLEITLVAGGLCALAANVAILMSQNAALASIANNEFSALEMFPYYGVATAAFILMGTAAYLFGGMSLKKGQAPRLSLILRGTACLLMFFGVLITRLGFYSLHMTIGF